ncbi:AGAP005612-PA-like protein [Anopheles sinensis]|uniref:AGAP005612-PA-like protein n=1 Tax=Anopheles sinensis TaxID=74873 RepID=A0A084VSS8_ANOSI|nr:AGAP005612-PA-like protein [Anopheles sinensis]
MANANAYGQYFGQNGFGYSAANAGAGAFMNQGPLGYMGASNANAASQNMNFGPGGVSASGAHTMTHEYDMFGKKVIVSNAAGFSVANGASSVTKSGSVSVA